MSDTVSPLSLMVPDTQILHQGGSSAGGDKGGGAELNLGLCVFTARALARSQSFPDHNQPYISLGVSPVLEVERLTEEGAIKA